MKKIPLTPRQRQIALLIARGNNVKQCARKLSLASGTIRAHRVELYRKLGVKKAARLVVVLLLMGIASLEDLR